MLLPISKNPPHKIGDLHFLRDIITVYFDMRINWWQACTNGIVSADKDVETFENYVENLKAEIIKKCRKDEKRRAIIFINDLDVTHFILPSGEKTQATKTKAGITYSLEYNTEFFCFRNFNIICNSKTEKVAQLFPGKPLCAAMSDFIKMFDMPIINIRYSLAYITKRVFYQDIKNELWQDTVKAHRIPRTRQLYYDMLAGSSSGLLSSFSDGENIFKVLHSIGSFDKRSAYPAYFVHDKYFPIGRVYEVCGTDSFRTASMRDAIRRGQWFKIVIDSDSEIEELKMFRDVGKLAAWYSEFVYGVEFWDEKILQKCGVDLAETINGKKFRIYRTEKTGYMPQCFREKIVYLYNIKNAIKDKNAAQRYLIKTQIDMIFGKGLQKYDFLTDADVFRKFVCRGDNFLLPQMSMHVVSAMRHELLTAAAHFSGSVTAFDTDGIKIDFAKMDKNAAIEYFEKMNEYIMEKNRAAGFYCNIGTWDFEYTAENFIQFAPKVYAYKDETGLKCKFAGVPERFLKKAIKNVPCETLFEKWENEGLSIEIGAGWCFLPERKIFIEQKTNYEIRKEK